MLITLEGIIPLSSRRANTGGHQSCLAGIGKQMTARFLESKLRSCTEHIKQPPRDDARVPFCMPENP